MEEQKEPKRMLEKRFLENIDESYRAGQRYCFVLGAGASKASGIRTGEEMMREWRNYLMKKGSDYIEDCAQELKLEPNDYQSIFTNDHILKNDDYFTLFDLRFAGMPNVAYAYLEKQMENKSPSYGYYPLSMLLSNTENRLVITTNFDFLIEDALHIYTSRHPLVVGHESLAPYIENDTRRPVIAKIHRDLLLHPLNRKIEMEELKKEWVNPLRSALSKYTPIVIGYAGGDRTFMSLLNEDEIKLKGIYWCHLEEPSDEIKETVRKHNGYLVKIRGFDEIMFQIGQHFSAEAHWNDPCQYIQDQAKEQCGLYQENFQKIKARYELQRRSIRQETSPKDKIIRYSPQKNAQDESAVSVFIPIEEIRTFDVIDRQSSKIVPVVPDAENLVSEAKREAISGDRTRADELYAEAMRNDRWQPSKIAPLRPDAPNFASEAQREAISGNLARAVKLYTKAIHLVPDNIEYHRKRGLVLYRLQRFEEVLEDDTKVIELDPLNPDNYNSRAMTLRRMNRLGSALLDQTKAIELAPSQAEFYRNRATILRLLCRDDEAREDEEKAAQLEK